MYKRLVIKVGSHVLTQDNEISHNRMNNLVEFISKLKEHNCEVILVSSGAVSAGYTKLSLDKKIIENRQALASIGQPLLLKLYQQKFEKYGIICSQVLLYSEVFENSEHLYHAKAAIDTLLQNSVVPILNENDTVTIDELLFGDNDRMSAHVAHFFDASLLVLLSDIDALYDKDPNKCSDAKVRSIVRSISDEELTQEHTPNNEFATGGIVTKLQAADFLLKHNKEMFLSSGFNLGIVESFVLDNTQNGGTLFSNNTR